MMRLTKTTLWLVMLLGLVLMLAAASVQGQETAVGLADTNLRARASQYEPLIAAAAARYHVDPRLLWTIAYLESRFRQSAVSYKEGKPCAYGMMQFTPPTAARFGLKDPHNVSQAIDAAARYVSELQQRFGLRGDLILAAYNAGEGTVEAFRDGKRLVLSNNKIINPGGLRTGGIPPYLQTREYVARGRIVYQSISRAGLFQGRTREAAAGVANEDSVSNSAVEAVAPAGSIYIGEPKAKLPSQPATKPTKNRSTTATPSSIYVD